MQSSLDAAPACSVFEIIPATTKYFLFFPNQKDTWQQLLRHFVMEAHGPESPAALAAWSAPGDGKLVALRHFKWHLGHFKAL